MMYCSCKMSVVFAKFAPKYIRNATSKETISIHIAAVFAAVYDDMLYMSLYRAHAVSTAPYRRPCGKGFGNQCHMRTVLLCCSHYGSFGITLGHIVGIANGFRKSG